MAVTVMPIAAPQQRAMRLCFVIGPIGAAGTEVRKHADWLLLGIIKPVLEAEEFGYRVKRADEDADPGMISDRMIGDILHADLVVADLTGLNPNAFYELGIRHSTEKPVIHVAAVGTILPFDNSHHRAITVDVSDYRSFEAAKLAIAASARHINTTDYRVSNIITQANLSLRMREKSKRGGNRKPAMANWGASVYGADPGRRDGEFLDQFNSRQIPRQVVEGGRTRPV
jgi:hypothetical protein